MPEQLELLLRVLAAYDRDWGYSDETSRDLFGGDALFWRYHRCWLSSVRLLAAGPQVNPLSAGLSDEGRSVLAMLRATREPEWTQLPFAAVLDAVRNADRTAADDDRERPLRAFERDVVNLPFVFAREAVHTSHLVTLTGAGHGRAHADPQGRLEPRLPGRPGA